MSVVVADQLSGKLRPINDVSLADKVLDLRKNKNPWRVIEQLVAAWEERSPEDFIGFKAQIKDTRDNQVDSKFARTRNQDMDRRLVVVLPQTLHDMIRSMFTPQEFPMDKKFFIEFARRFPFFKVPEKL